MRFLFLLFVFFIVGCSSSPSDTYSIEAMSREKPRPAPLMVNPNKSSTEKLTTKTPKQIGDPVASQLYKASLAFVVPTTANINDTLNAQLLIDPSKEIDELEKQLSTKGTTITKKIEVSRKVVAKLTAVDFHLENVTPITQVLSDTQPTEWLWELRPKSIGNHEIKLTVVAIIKIDNESSEHHIKTFDKIINVTITPPQVILGWLSKYWQWLFSTLIIPLVIFVYKTKSKIKD